MYTYVDTFMCMPVCFCSLRHAGFPTQYNSGIRIIVQFFYDYNKAKQPVHVHTYIYKYMYVRKYALAVLQRNLVIHLCTKNTK